MCPGRAGGGGPWGPVPGGLGVVESCLGDVGWTLRGNVGRGTGAAGGGTKRGRGTKAGGKERKERKRAADQGVVRKAPGAPDDRAAPRAGDVVGQGAPVIGEGNRGFAMMQAMGWKVGEGTGAAAGAGRVEPVEAVVRAKRRGDSLISQSA
ncbi:hypothetical protein HK101_010008 [Irineochytrium annulatum]|nr:hypothetical protein HK101_010008 [Irineochytrium annulatum]